MSTLTTTENAVQAAQTQAGEASAASTKKQANYGKTIGKPQLSDKAQEYYKELKKKFSNMDFILVSSDMKDVAKARAASYANPNKLVVLIDEENLGEWLRGWRRMRISASSTRALSRMRGQSFRSCKRNLAAAPPW